MQNLIENVISVLEKGNYLEAIKICDDLIAAFPEKHILFEIRGNCYLETGSYIDAIDNFNEAIKKIDPSDEKCINDLAALYNRKGFAEIKINEYSSAVENFKHAEKIKPEYPELFNNFANAYRKLEEYKLAIDYCDKAIAIKPDFAEAYNNRGNVYYMLSKDLDAINDYTRAIEINPVYAGAYFNRGTVYFYLQNDLINAKKDWERSIELNPDYLQDLSDKLKEIDEKLNMVKENAYEGIENPQNQIESLEKEFADLSEIHNEHLETVVNVVPEEPVPEKNIKSEKENIPIESVQEHTLETEEIVVPAVKVPEQNSDMEKEKLHVEEFKIDIQQDVLNEEINKNIESHDDMQKHNDEIPKEKKDFELPEIYPSASGSNEKTTSDINYENSDIFKDMDDYFKTIDTSKVEKDIEIPDINFKDIFAENKGEEILESKINTEEAKPKSENIIPHELKQLHEEITKIPAFEITDGKLKEKVNDEKSEAPTIAKTEMKQQKEYTPLLRDEFISRPASSKKRILPIMIVLFLVLVFISVASYLIYQKFGIKLENIAVKTDTTLNRTKNDANKSTDSKIKEQPKEEIDNQTTAKKEKPKEITKSTTLSIEGRNDLILINEGNKYYIQAGSFKDKASADAKSKKLLDNGVKSEIKEFDLGEKGIYYRVRIGTFDTPESAKEYAAKIVKD